GNRWSAPENNRSTVVHMRFDEKSTIGTANGAWPLASVFCVIAACENENPGTNEPDPKCSDSDSCASSHTAHSGSQWSVWNDGRPMGTGLSGNEIVRAPFSATRFASSTEASMSHT